MTTRIVYVALMDGSLVPLDRVTRMSESEDGCAVAIDGEGRRCAGKTFVESLRTLEFRDRAYWTGEEAEQ